MQVTRIFTVGVFLLHTLPGLAAAAAREPRTLQGPEDPAWGRVQALEFLLETVPRPAPRVPTLPGVRLPAGHPALLDEAAAGRFSTSSSGSEAGGDTSPGGSLGDRDSGGHGDGAGLDWGPWVGPIDLRVAAHVMNRAMIGPRYEEIRTFRDLGIEDGVDWLLQPQPLPVGPSWADEPIPQFDTLTPDQVDSVLQVYFTRQHELRAWWAEHIVYGQEGLTETMVHFWHDHFANEARTVIVPMSMYWQNDLFRRYALGNFRELVKAVAKDPAMLIYLDGYRNKVGHPNENFARELMELFTMGEGSGYTQRDVEEVARACTGWTTDGLQSFFVPADFDPGIKVVLGKTGFFNMDQVIDVIFEQDATARYLCTKLYKWFVDDEPTAEDIEYLAGILRQNDYEVAPVLRVILSSRRLIDLRMMRGSLIRDGLDLYAGQIRRFHVAGFHPTQDLESLQSRWLLFSMYAYGHILFDPPNVAGWPGHRDWINTYTLPLRKLLSQFLVDGVIGREPLGMQIDVIGEASGWSDPDDVYRMVDDLALLSFGQPPAPSLRQRMVDEVLQGDVPENWFLDHPTARERLEDLFRFAMRLPDYQLK